MLPSRCGFGDFVGNEQGVDLLRILVEDTKENKQPFPPLGIFGPSGHGKTSLVEIVANELGRRFCYVNSTAARTPLIIRSRITDSENLKHGAIVFLDECHQLPKKVQDNLLSVVERPHTLITEIKGELLIDKVPDHITFAFATTDKGMINGTLLSRLEKIELREYSAGERQIIAVNYLKQNGLKPEQFDVDAILEVGRRSRSARAVIHLCDKVTRMMRVKKVPRMSVELVDTVCNTESIDQNGLTFKDRRLLHYLYNSGFCGVDNLQAYLQTPKKEIIEVIEPWLIRNKLIMRHAAGRTITNKGIMAMRGQRIEYE